MPYFEYQNRNYFYWDHGEGKPLIFQHGLGADHKQIVQILSKVNGIRLICLDCPGHGVNMLQENEEVSFDAYSHLVLALIDFLGIEEFTVGGLSMGAGIAIQIALRVPEKINGLILLRPAWLATPNPAHLDILKEVAQFVEVYGRGEGKERFRRFPTWKQLSEENPACASSILNQFSREREEDIIGTLKGMVNSSPVKSLREYIDVKIPALVLGNEQDPLHPVSLAIELNKNLHLAEYRNLPPRYFNPDVHQQVVSIEIASFLEKLSRDRT